MSSSFNACLRFLASTDLRQSQIAEGVQARVQLTFLFLQLTGEKLDNKFPSNVLKVPPQGN